MARECAKPGLPLVIAEFGWYGGGPLNPKGKPATEEQQSEWCRHLLEVTSPMACGWLNWGMYDHPQAEDVSKLTGLFTVDGKEKAWGRTFRDAARAVPGQSPAVRDPRSPRPALGGLYGQRRRDGEVPPDLSCQRSPPTGTDGINDHKLWRCLQAFTGVVYNAAASR